MTVTEYVLRQEQLNEDAFLIYTLCNDLSHGAIRTDILFDEATIQRSCRAVITHVRNRYGGQITKMEQELGVSL